MVSRSLLLALRLCVSVGLLWFLFATVDIDLGYLWPDDAAAVIWLSAGFACMIASIVVAAWRWQQVCRALGVVVPTSTLFWHNAAGQFLANFFPTTVGGDVLRVSRLGRDIQDRPTSFTTVIFERLSGWMILPGAIVVGLMLDPALRDLGAATRAALGAATLTLVGLLAVILAAGNEASGRWLDRYEEPLRWLHAIHEGLDVLRAMPVQVGRILGTGAVYQGLLVLAFWCVAHSLGIAGFGLRAALAFVPAVLIAQVLPVGIGGLGVREGALVLFLGALGVADEQSVALGLTIYGLTLATSLLGLPSLVFGGPRKGAADQASSGGTEQGQTSSP